MGRDFDIWDSDAFFSMRSKFWEESRDRALADKEHDEPSSQQYQESWELKYDLERKQRRVA